MGYRSDKGKISRFHLDCLCRTAWDVVSARICILGGKVKVAIDCDGTATKYPDFFMNLGRALKAAGHNVYVVTGIPRSVYFGKRLIKHPHLADDSWYDAVYTSDDYNEVERELAKKVISGDMDNVVLVGMFKQRICEELGVCVMFDDRATQQRSLGKVPMFEVT